MMGLVPLDEETISFIQPGEDTTGCQEKGSPPKSNQLTP